LTIATIAEALEATICVPPALIVVLVAVPPDTTTCEPVKTVAAAGTAYFSGRSSLPPSP
jgi:hypothetical protein